MSFSENKETVDEMLKDNGVKTQFPVAEFIATMGFFLIMFVEHLVMSLQHRHGEVDSSSREQSSADERRKLIDWHNSGHEGQDHYHHHENQDNQNGMLIGISALLLFYYFIIIIDSNLSRLIITGFHVTYGCKCYTLYTIKHESLASTEI